MAISGASVAFYVVLYLVCDVYGASPQYDVNAEAKKIYGEDLETVLGRFRRSEYYLKILQEEVENLEYVYLLNNYDLIHSKLNNITQKVKDGLESAGGKNSKATEATGDTTVEATTAETTTVETTTVEVTTEAGGKILLRSRTNKTTGEPVPTPSGNATVTPRKRADCEEECQDKDKDTQNATIEAITNLEKHFNWILSLEQRNKMRNLGFEIASELVKLATKSLGPDKNGGSGGSTGTGDTTTDKTR